MTTEDVREAADLLAGLEDLGVQVWIEDTQLRYRAPRGVLTTDRLESLRSRRDEITALLRSAGAPAELRPDEAGRYEPFPLTEVQSAYLTGRAGTLPYGAVGCHGYGELRFEAVDPARLQAAWQQLVRRHDMLRATVTADRAQQVRPELPDTAIAVRDLGPVSPEQLAAAVEQTRAAMDHRVYQPGESPLFDLRLTVGNSDGVLHFSLDFLIADFVSIQLLLTELEQAYAGTAAAPADLEITFRDVLLADRARRTGAAAQRDRAWWTARLDTLPGPPELPVLADPHPPARFERLAGALSAAEWAGFQARAREHGVTPTCAVLAAYADVLRRWSRRPEFTLNVTVLNRPPVHPQVAALVGDFTSVELLAVRDQPGRPFGARAVAVQAQLWEDLDHGLCNGIEVMRELRRRSDELTLFPVVFTSAIGLNDAAGAGPGGLGRLVHGISQTPQVWLDCQAMEIGPTLSVNWDLRTGVFPDGLAGAMFATFTGRLRELAATGAAWASTAPVALPAGQLAHRPRPEPPVPTAHRLLADGFVEQVAARPDAPAVLAGDRTLSYRELAERAGAVTAALDTVAPPGGIVAVEMDKGWEQIAAVLGVVLGGRAYVPVDTTQPVARRDRILADVGAAAVLTQSWRLAEATRGDRPVLAVDALDPVPASPGPARGEPDDLAYVIYTSGSTGTPKGVMISHRAALTTIEDVNDRFAVTPADRVLGLANLGFDLSVYDLFGVLAAGGAVVLPDADRRGDPGHWVGLAERHGVTVWNSVPAQLEMLSAYLQSDPAVRLPGLRLALLSGDWIPVTLPGAIRRRLPGLRVVSLGGATEAAIWSIWHPADEVDEQAPSVPYGRALRGQTVEVLGPELEPVPDLVVGEIFIGGAGLSAGYLGDPERTAQRFRRHPVDGRRLYRTGDLGRYRADGAIEFLGREDAQVKIRGHRVELAEIESALVGHPAVGAAAVLPVGRRPEPVRLAAFVEAARTDPAGGPGPEELRTVAVAAAAALRAEVDEDQMLAFAAELDATGLLQMLATLRGCGLFGAAGETHTVEEVLRTARVAPRHHRLVRRWLAALHDNGLLHRDPATGGYGRPAGADADAAAVAAGWARVETLVPPVERRTELVDYFRTAAANLPELLSAELDPLALLFPAGRTEIHEVAYTAMFLSRYVNTLLTAAAGELAGRHRGPAPFRVLEVGAGVGGTSVEVIPALAAYDVEYLFTDVSEFFLNNARRRFADQPWVDFARYDLNEDYRAQGLRPNSVELIVCANVLHYAKDADATLARLRELLVPGGWLLFIEATRDSYQIMTSMEFLFDEGSGDFTDARRVHEQTFLTREQWLDVLAGAGADGVLSLPEHDRITDRMGMHVFAARFKSDRAAVSRPDLEVHLLGQLPDHMLPSHLEVVDRLPLTGNGKVDRQVLASWLAAEAGDRRRGGGGESPVGRLEQRLAEVWRPLLRADRIGRDENFFALGGDSLLAAQLATEIREQVPAAAGVFYDDLLRLLLENPTVASLAAQLEQAPAPAAAAGARPGPGPLQPVADGPGRTVLVHGGTGTLDWSAPLVAELTGRTGLAGLTVVDAEEYLAGGGESMLERTAADYVAALRAAGWDRIRLVGIHAGAVLAAEVARQLTEAGGTVEQLVAVAPAHGADQDEALAELVFWSELGLDPDALELPVPAGGGPLGVPERLRAEPGPARRRRLADRVAGIPLEQAYAVFRRSTRVAETAQLLPYAGDVTLVRPRRSVLGADPAEVEAYWRDVCLGDLTVVDVDGDELDCLRGSATAVAALLVDG